MLPMLVYAEDINVEHIVIGRPVENFKLVMAAPITLTSNIEFFSDTLIYILCFSLIVLLFSLLVYLLDFQQERWEIFYIFQILMGVPILQPRRITERIVYFTLVILSIHYSSDLFAHIADTKLIHQEQTFNTINEVLESSMNIHTRYSAENYKDGEVKRLFFESKKIKNSNECLNMQIKRKNIVCVISFQKAMRFINKNTNIDGKRPIKIAKPSFRHKFLHYVYEKGSPFAELIEKTVQQIVESGIPVVLQSRTKRATLNKYAEASRLTEIILPKYLIRILLNGSLLSIMSFCVN